MNDKQIFSLLHEFWADLASGGFYGIAAALALVLFLSWWIAHRWLRVGARARAAGLDGFFAFGADGLRRIAWPLIALILTAVLRGALEFFKIGHLALLGIATLLLLSWVLVRLLVFVLRGVFPRGGFLRSSERLTAAVIWGGMVLEMTGLADPAIEWLRQIKFSVGAQKFNLWMILQGSVTVCVTLLVALWFASLVERRLMAVRELDANLREVLVRLAKALLTVVALLFSLSLLGIDITALSVFSGALAVGLGLGLQRIASNYVSGFIILLDRSIRLGNLIALDDNTTGTVTRITTRYTVLRTLSGTEVIIPNEYMVSNMVRNLSFSDSLVRVATKVGVAYDTDVDRAIEIMKNIALAHPRVLADPAPGVLLTEFADSSLLLELGFWVEDPEKGTGGVRSDINREILLAFRKEGISIPFPQREVRML
ncbi:MAG: mechanosensitive ion channel [Candidatus Accumulibacter sp.]|jgi:small-conductance mechanosensitive channel|nr:mechanosensitive ion channel [Accumulibacter sp.]